MGPSAAELPDWREAARIAAEARELGATLAVPGLGRRELAEQVEGFIRSQGAQPAFPANLSRNVEAAHYTPSPDDEAKLQTGDLLKIDVGAHLGGAIADTAMSVEVGGGRRYEGLIRAARDAVEAAITQVRAGVSVDALARAIESTIHSRGLKPVSNLMGHSVERYLLHAGKSIPNVSGMSQARLVEGEIIAIEPFATNGAGSIENGPFGNIVRFRSAPEDPSVAAIFDRVRTLPFTARWLSDAERSALAKVRRTIQTYPVFVESGGGHVAQAEHTVRVLADGAEVLTLAR
jgi:methionyl aminopeptidase